MLQWEKMWNSKFAAFNGIPIYLCTMSFSQHLHSFYFLFTPRLWVRNISSWQIVWHIWSRVPSTPLFSLFFLPVNTFDFDIYHIGNDRCLRTNASKWLESEMSAKDYLFNRVECSFIESLKCRTKWISFIVKENNPNDCKPQKPAEALKPSIWTYLFFELGYFSEVRL